MTDALKTWPAPWDGEVLLACRKCQKKLRKDASMKPLARLRKTVKRRNRDDSGTLFHVIPVPCMKLCPKNGVTICLPARRGAELSILRSVADLDALEL